MLLTTLSGDFCWFIVLDWKKDAFYWIPLSPESWGFVFQWDDPETDVKQQHCWMELPQGFKNTPTIFREAFTMDLMDLPLNEGALLQCVSE